MSDWGWVAFGYFTVYGTLIAYVLWNIYQRQALRRAAADPLGERSLAGADITAPQLEPLEE